MKYISENLVALSVLAVVLGILVWLNLSAYFAWKGTGKLGKEGIQTGATVLSKEAHTMVKSADSYWATLQWYAPGPNGFDQAFSRRMEITQSLYHQLQEGGKTTVAYFAGNPAEAQILKNETYKTRLWVTLMIDAVIILGVLWLIIKSRMTG
jgi:hypothetical protein